MTIQENTSKIKEIWKSIKRYEEQYAVSNFGRVRRLNRKDSLGRDVRSKILKSSYDRDGYQVISLRKDNKKPIYGFKGDRIIWFPSVLNAIKFMNNLTGKNVTNISNTLSGKNHTCFGWNFKYAEEVEKSGKNT